MTGHAYLDPVVRPKDILEVFDRIEYVNANSTIEARRLEKPQIFALVLGGSNGERRSDDLIEGTLRKLQLVVQFSG